MRQYIALIHKDEGSDYGVSFPDLPGCVTAGVDLDEARRMAEEALALHLAGMAEDGEPIPESSSLEAVMADRENRDAVAILVKAPPVTAKAVRVNMTIPEDELELIDKFAAAQGMTRSGFLLHAAKKAIEAAGAAGAAWWGTQNELQRAPSAVRHVRERNTAFGTLVTRTDEMQADPMAELARLTAAAKGYAPAVAPKAEVRTRSSHKKAARKGAGPR